MVISNPKRMSVADGVDHFIVFSLLNIPGMSLVCMMIILQILVQSYPENHYSWLAIFASHCWYVASLKFLSNLSADITTGLASSKSTT